LFYKGFADGTALMATSNKNTPFDGQNYLSKYIEQAMWVSNCNIYVYLPMVSIILPCISIFQAEEFLLTEGQML